MGLSEEEGPTYSLTLREAMDKEGISYEKMIKEFATEKKIETSTGADGWSRSSRLTKYQGKVCRVIIISN